MSLLEATLNTLLDSHLHVGRAASWVTIPAIYCFHDILPQLGTGLMVRQPVTQKKNTRKYVMVYSISRKAIIK